MKKQLLLILISTLWVGYANAQQCLSGGCTNFGTQYPSLNAPYTPPSSWTVLNNPSTGNDALMNASNYTRFNVTSGNTYEWSYCEAYGGVSTSWDAQMTLFNDANLSAPICFSTDQCGTNGNAPYISWTATFTGTARILTTAYTTTGCQTNSGSPYNKMAYRQVSASCTSPTSAVNSPTGLNPLTITCTASGGSGGSILYKWYSGTSCSGTILGTSSTYSATTSGNYSCKAYISGYESTCYNCAYGYATITTSGPTIYGIDVSNNQGSIDWTQVFNSGKVFAYIKSSQGYTTDGNDTYFASNITPAINSGLIIGAYHVGMPPNYTAAQEATHFLNTAGNYIGTGFLPPALDIEDPYVATYLSTHTTAQLAQWVSDWCSQVHNSSGIWPVVYVDRCRANYLVSSYGGIIDSNIKLWIADTGSPAGSPSGYSGCGPNWNIWPWYFHQYSWTGSVSGISVNVDLDVFNGNQSAFNTLIGTTSSFADLTIAAGSQSVSSSTVAAGSNVTAYAGETNGGTVTAASSTVVHVWLATSSVLNTNTDIFLGSITGYPSIGASSSSSTLSASVTIPANTVAGSYYLFFWADGGTCSTGSNCSTCFGSVSESNECNNFASIQITVTCTTPGAVTVSGAGTFCNSSVLTATGGSGGTIYWQGTTSNGTSTSDPTNTQTVSSSGTYYFRAYNSCGWGPEGSAIITINTSPGSVTVNGGGTFCNNATLTASGGSGGTIYWQGTTSGGTSTADPINTQTVSSSGTYYFRAYNSCGWGPEGSATISINIANTSVYASGDSLIAAAVGAAYQWIYCDGGLITGETSQSFSASLDSSYAVIITDNGCTDTSICYTIFGVGLSENNFTSNVLIYPNPTNDVINIVVYSLSNDKFKLIITNTIGEILNEKEIRAINGSVKIQYDLKNLASGIYFLNIISDLKQQIFIVQKL